MLNFDLYIKNYLKTLQFFIMQDKYSTYMDRTGLDREKIHACAYCLDFRRSGSGPE